MSTKSDTAVNGATAMPRDRDAEASERPSTRAPYTPPRIERLGEWSALTLQQSVGIGPGEF